MISHHGSITGHPAFACKYVSRLSPLDCAANKLEKAILMGRDGAYPGIYSKFVVNHWRGLPSGLEMTEKTLHYVELNRADGGVAYK